MAVGETTLSMHGTICGDLVRREFGDGTEVVSFLVISNERRFDKQIGDWVDGRKFSVRVKCWRRLATNVYASLQKGDQVMVSGRLRSTEFDEDGKTRYGLELDAFAVGPNLKNAVAHVRKIRGDRLVAAANTSAA